MYEKYQLSYYIPGIYINDLNSIKYNTFLIIYI